MKRALTALLFSAATAVTSASAQTPIPAGRPGEDPLFRLFFPPELVLQQSQALALQPGQRTTIITAVKEAQGDLFDLQLQMSDRSQELMKLLGGGAGPVLVVDGKVVSPPERLDEAAVLAQVDRVLAVERDMKRRQLQLLIRIRNALTREQQEQLTRYREVQAQPRRPDGAPF
jgi:FtsP/CotA-like multicopper oxidase with cupredoxin domain